MDARPYRPRGAENAVNPLHQRQKSSGNIMTTSTSTNGFRGPAKRAAFGDVTNVTKVLGVVRDESKAGKNLGLTVAGQTKTSVTLNKENGPYTKDAFSRPPQRPSVLGNKPPVALDNRAEGVRKSSLSIPHDPILYFTEVETDRRQQHAKVNAAMDKKISSIVSNVSDAPAFQPRHYKSQPQLKPQQPTLRRTQSKQLERTESEKMVSELMHTGLSHVPSSSSVMEFIGLPERELSTEPELREDYSDVHVKLPGITEESVSDSYSFKEGHAHALSEPEECWDEIEDEDYDDQDQAYTTAHSTRSRDLTMGNATTLLAPRVNARVQRELLEARLEVEGMRSVEDVEDELWDVSMVAEYGEEIFEYLRELEIKMLPNPHYMEMQTEIQWSMRSVLMDWLVQVHNRFNLLPETLFLTVNYIDRFLSSKIVSIGKLQLVGATALLVASKYEEINCPSLEEIVYMVDGGYTADEILKAERFMLSMLSFELGWPGPMSFLRRVSKADDYDLETRTLAKYFLELTIMDERFVASPPSFLAAGAHCLSRLILNKGDWTKHHVHYSGYTWSQLKSLVTMMIECCENPPRHHTAIFEKYKEKRFKEASLIVQDTLDAGFTLPNHNSPARRPLANHHKHEEIDFLSGLLVPTEG